MPKSTSDVEIHAFVGRAPAVLPLLRLLNQYLCPSFLNATSYYDLLFLITLGSRANLRKPVLDLFNLKLSFHGDGPNIRE